MSELSSNILAFCALLRTEHDFSVGAGEAADALRALDIVGLTDRDRVRSVLRLICCGTHEQTLVFDGAFDEFFLRARLGVAQPTLAARNSRPGREQAPASSGERPAAPPTSADDGAEGATGTAVRRHVSNDERSADAWRALRARYSPLAARGEPPRIDRTRSTDMRPVAADLVRRVRLGHSRRWKSLERGRRFDLRRTFRASLETGGDPFTLRFLGHPLRNPRFVVLIDGSRSMVEHTGAVVEFAAALCERTARATAFFFSTELLDVTRKLRTSFHAGADLTGLGESWGGGTKIGEALTTFVARYGARLLTPETVVLVCSDGLDVGETLQLERALRAIDRRSAGIVWLNPHAASAGYAPTARGMRAALPFVTLLCAANDERGFKALVDRIARTPRIRGRRG